MASGQFRVDAVGTAAETQHDHPVIAVDARFGVPQIRRGVDSTAVGTVVQGQDVIGLRIGQRRRREVRGQFATGEIVQRVVAAVEHFGADRLGARREPTRDRTFVQKPVRPRIGTRVDLDINAPLIEVIGQRPPILGRRDDRTGSDAAAFGDIPTGVAESPDVAAENRVG